MGLFTVAAPIVLRFTKDQAFKYIEGQVDQRVIRAVNKRVQDELNIFINRIRNRTRAYYLFTLVNLIALIAMFAGADNLPLNLLAVGLSGVFLIYMVWSTITSFITIINQAQNFEANIKQTIEQELKAAMSEKWTSKVAIWVNTKDAHDYYHLVLNEIVRSISTWLKVNKGILYLRLAFYFFASFSLTYSLKELL